MSHIQIPPEILSLSVDDRIELVHLIWNSIAESKEVYQLSREQEQLLDARLAEAQERPDKLIPADQAFRELMSE